MRFLVQIFIAIPKRTNSVSERDAIKRCIGTALERAERREPKYPDE